MTTGMHSRLTQLNVFVSTGELSGDMHASALVKALKNNPRLPPISLSAIGSFNLRAEGAKILDDVFEVSSIGVLANIPKLPRAYRRFQRAVGYVLSSQVQLVILVDYRFFNLALASALRKRGYKGVIVYYIVPTLWQSAFDERYRQPAKAPKSFLKKISKRYEILKKFCNLCIAIYPIGLELLEFFRVPYIYIGHPLCEVAKPRMEKSSFLELISAKGKRLIGIMPGSRIMEVNLVGAELIKSLRILSRELPDCTFALPVAHPRLRDILEQRVKEQEVDVKLISSELRYDLISSSELVLVSSGTSAHECLILGTPHIIAYKLPWLHDFLYSKFTRFRLPFYGFTNICAGAEVVPELLRSHCTAERIAEEALLMMKEPIRLNEVRQNLTKLREQICRPSPLESAACEIAQLLYEKGIIG